MYARYAEAQGWRVEVVSSSPAGGMGGYKEIIAQIEGDGADSRLKYESGVHRVQRVPVTEAPGKNSHLPPVHPGHHAVGGRGRVNIDPTICELRLPLHGHGARASTRTDSAVAAPLPTGLVVTCKDEKSSSRTRTRL
jgi:peptide chain release factor 1